MGRGDGESSFNGGLEQNLRAFIFIFRFYLWGSEWEECRIPFILIYVVGVSGSFRAFFLPIFHLRKALLSFFRFYLLTLFVYIFLFPSFGILEVFWIGRDWRGKGGVGFNGIFSFLSCLTGGEAFKGG